MDSLTPRALLLVALALGAAVVLFVLCMGLLLLLG